MDFRIDKVDMVDKIDKVNKGNKVDKVNKSDKVEMVNMVECKELFYSYGHGNNEGMKDQTAVKDLTAQATSTGRENLSAKGQSTSSENLSAVKNQTVFEAIHPVENLSAVKDKAALEAQQALEALPVLEDLAVNNVSFKVKKGEFLVVLGRNGSGKSTVAKHLNALLLPGSGKVFVDGMDTSDYNNTWLIRNKAGMVFQNPDNQIVATIVEEDVAFGPENLGVPSAEIRKRVDEALKTVEMYEYRKHAPHLLSGGQKQRVAIAGILAMRPDCIIFDEPTAMLDPSGRKEVIETIKDLNKRAGITIILITHFMEEAVEADRIIVMDAGKIHLEGKPQEIFSKVEAIKKMGLDVPQVTELAYKLRKRGLKLSDDILTIDKMVKELCKLK